MNRVSINCRFPRCSTATKILSTQVIVESERIVGTIIHYVVVQAMFFLLYSTIVHFLLETYLLNEGNPSRSKKKKKTVTWARLLT